MRTSYDCLDEIAFLTRSSTRTQILQHLRQDSPVNKNVLRDRFECDRTTFQRNLNALIEHGWVERINHKVQITQTGRLLDRALSDCMDVTNTAIKLKPLLRGMPDDAFDFDIERLGEGEIAVADSTDPDRAVSKQVNALQSAEKFRGFFPSIGRHALETIWRRVTNDDCTFEVVVSAESVDTLAPGSRFAGMFGDLLQSDSFVVRMTDEHIPYYLGIVDGVVQIGIQDDTGMRTALLETKDKIVHSWAVDTYKDYKQRAPVLETEQTNLARTRT